MTETNVGISGFAAYLPRYRVALDEWCRWNDDSWDKVSRVVGSSFRMRAPDENAYTMAATAVLRLIEQYDLDPRRVGLLALGTESSTDNSAGAVIVKGMVNEALLARALAPLKRQCEVPEFKHACLGGVYAMKAAARYLALDGRDAQAIVVCSDIAEYERGTSGEPTQGAGAVAMLMEREPTLLSIDLSISGSASDYRGPDFRKPFCRFMSQELTTNGQPRDFPVFNGKYSTTCYVDEVLLAADDMFGKIQGSPVAFLDRMRAVFLHRPYQRMAETGLVMTYLFALSRGEAGDRAVLDDLAADAEVDAQALVSELAAKPEVYDLVRGGNLTEELYPLAMATVRAFRRDSGFDTRIRAKLALGGAEMTEVGNLYTASLAAWMAAGLEAAEAEDIDLTGAEILTLGYGSGDAAEAIPMRVEPGWHSAARAIAFRRALADPVDLGREEYERLHDTGELAGRDSVVRDAFVIDRIGQREAQYDDTGVEYYRYVGG